MTEINESDAESKNKQIISNKLSEMVGEQQNSVENEYQSFYEWMREKGISHVKQKGLNKTTTKNYLQRVDRMHREVISLLEVEDETTITPDQADELHFLLARDEITKQNGEPYLKGSKRKLSNALKKYFEWQYHTGNLEFEWNPRIQFSDGNHTPAAEFTYEEVGRLFEAAKSYGKLPSYYETSPEERDRINGLVAQRLSKPKAEINREDWRKADHSSKIWSLISVGYDAGLTPMEIGQATVDWYNPDQQTLRIPTEFASKERNKQEVSLSDDSCEGMSLWIRERRHLEKYDGTNMLWLNRDGNPYNSKNLCYLIRKLCENADIPSKDRPIRWYSLRHSIGRQMKSDGSLTQTNDQLRHDTLETTATTYGNSALEERRETLNKSRSKAERAANDPDYEPYSDIDVSTKVEDLEETGPEDAVTKRNDGLMHTNVVMKDTTENRVDVSRQLLNEDSSEDS